jgi:HK97 gp10 family phage protein
MAKNKTTFFAEASLNLHTAEAFFFVNEALFDATQEIVGFAAVERAKELAPVLKEATKERKPGELRDSIDARVNRVTSGKRPGVRARITTNCGYGGFVELGTARTGAEPFLWPAFEQVIQRLPEAVKANLATYTTSGDAEKQH